MTRRCYSERVWPEISPFRSVRYMDKYNLKLEVCQPRAVPSCARMLAFPPQGPRLPAGVSGNSRWGRSTGRRIPRSPRWFFPSRSHCSISEEVRLAPGISLSDQLDAGVAAIKGKPQARPRGGRFNNPRQQASSRVTKSCCGRRRKSDPARPSIRRCAKPCCWWASRLRLAKSLSRRSDSSNFLLTAGSIRGRSEGVCGFWGKRGGGLFWRSPRPVFGSAGVRPAAVPSQ